MFRPLFTIILLVFCTTALPAQNSKPLPIHVGKFYHVWFGPGETKGNWSLVKPDTSIEVLDTFNNWIRVKSIRETGYAKILWVASEVRSDTEIGKKLLAATNKDKDAFLKEVETHPLASMIATELWINTDQIAAFQQINSQ